MSVSAHFSATTAAALALGGIAAIALAMVMALRGSHRHAVGKLPVAVSQAASRDKTPLPAVSMGGAPSEAEIEYLLDTSD